MKIIRQIVIIWAVTLAGELLSALVPLPIPAGVYGLVLMLVLLLTGALKLEQVEQTALYLVEIMPVMFIPAAVGLMVSTVAVTASSISLEGRQLWILKAAPLPAGPKLPPRSQEMYV